MQIITPSGHKVEFKDYLTFGQKRELEQMLVKDVKVKASKTGMVGTPEIDAVIAYQMQDKAFQFLVKKIIIDDKEYTTNLFDLVQNWKEEDGEAVYQAIDELTNKKK